MESSWPVPEHGQEHDLQEGILIDVFRIAVNERGLPQKCPSSTERCYQHDTGMTLIKSRRGVNLRI